MSNPSRTQPGNAWTWAILAGVLVLLLAVLALTTYQRLERDKELMVQAMTYQGSMSIRHLEGATRASMRRGLWQGELLQMLVEEMVKHPHMLSFALIGPGGKVLAFGKRGNESTDNSAVLAGLPESIKDKVANNQPLEVFLGNELILGQLFEPFRGFGRLGRGMPPWAFPLSPGHHSGMPGAGHMRGRHLWKYKERTPEKIYALVRISTQDFLDARRKAVQEALILAALIFMAAGAASWGLWAVARRRSQEMDRLRREVAQAEHLASLGRLAGSVAHEVRNPLSALRGLVQLLAKGHDSETREAKYAAAAVEEVDRLERVVSGLLDYTRPREPRRFPLD
ncbi:MAG: histidine kinase dimerization/phospho-acceptor domain-containing protein, partial [Desulfarculaceae bacterium]